MSTRTVQIFLAGLFIASAVWLWLVGSQNFYGWPVTRTAELTAEKMTASGTRGAAVFRIPVRESQPGCLFEDSREIGISAAKISEVTEQGHGRFKTKSGQLHFSSSDGTNPAQNGRKYVFCYPWKAIPPLAILAGILVFAVSGGALYFMHRVAAGHLLSRIFSADSLAGRAFERIVIFFSDREAVSGR